MITTILLLILMIVALMRSIHPTVSTLCHIPGHLRELDTHWEEDLTERAKDQIVSGGSGVVVHFSTGGSLWVMVKFSGRILL